MLSDLRYAARMLMRSRGFLAVSVLAAGLAIGGNIAIFSVINAVLLRPLGGVREPGRLVFLSRELRGRPLGNFSYPDYLDLQNRARTLAGIAASCPTPLSMANGANGEPLRLRAELVSGNYFSVLGVASALGRLIALEDDIAGHSESIAVLSFDLWQSRFSRDASAVGKSIVLNGHSFTVAGVVDKSFRGSSAIQGTDIWVAVASQPQSIPRLSPGVLENRNSKWLGLLGRLAPGVPVNQAYAEVRTLGQQLDLEHPEANEGTLGIHTGVGLGADERKSLEGFLGGLQAACALLLIIACSNVAGLFLMRGRARAREVAIRQAIGATRGALVRQFLVEGLMLSVAAAVLALLCTPWLTRLILLISPPYYNLIEANASIDLAVLVLAALLAISIGSVFGLLPGLSFRHDRLGEAIKETATSAGRRRAPAQDLLVVAQVALSLLLVVGAGLLLRSMQNIRALNKGFDDTRLVLSSIDLSIQGYSEQKGRAFYQSLLARIQSIPGVESASLAKTVPPYDWSDRVSIFYEGQQPTREEFTANWEMGLRVDADRVAPAFFKTMGIPLAAGRDFTSEDRPDSRPVAIISQKLAARLWPGESSIGRRVIVPLESSAEWTPIEIIGVAGDVRYRSLTADPGYLIYFPELQSYDGRATLVVRSSLDPATVLPAIRSEVARLDSTLPLYRSIPMSSQIADSLWRERMAEALLLAAALAALALVAIGLYSVVAHYAAQRTREFGIRIALGATSPQVVGLMLQRASALLAAGVAVGLGVLPLLIKSVSGTLYQVSGYDPPILLGSIALLAAVVWAAGLIPARRAGRTDPMEVMRCE